MTLLADREIAEAISKGRIGLVPYDHDMLQPASIDVRLGNTVLVHTSGIETDPKYDSSAQWEKHHIPEDGIRLEVHDFILGTTLEWLSLPALIGARFEGKSSLGRIGLLTHITAGFIDPGFSGNITVEMANVSRRPIRLYPGMKIGQLCFMHLCQRPVYLYGNRPKGSHYQNQTGPQPSRIHENFHQATI